jgi:hypothetical protein
MHKTLLCDPCGGRSSMHSNSAERSLWGACSDCWPGPSTHGGRRVRYQESALAGQATGILRSCRAPRSFLRESPPADNTCGRWTIPGDPLCETDANYAGSIWIRGITGAVGRVGSAHH